MQSIYVDHTAYARSGGTQQSRGRDAYNLPGPERLEMVRPCRVCGRSARMVPWQTCCQVHETARVPGTGKEWRR